METTMTDKLQSQIEYILGATNVNPGIEHQAEITENRIKDILHNWHEAGRTEFEKSYPYLNYDSLEYSKHFHVGTKYIRLNVGSSGAVLVQFWCSSGAVLVQF